MIVRKEHKGRLLRPAFSLIEVVLVITVVSMIVALSLAGIQQIRERANGTLCANSLRQVGMAMIGFHDTNRMLPCNGGWDGKQRIAAVDGSFFVPSTRDKGLKTTFFWGVGDPDRPPWAQGGSWAYTLLPFLEQTGIFLSADRTAPVSVYVCPSRRGNVSYFVAPEDAYGIYDGGQWRWSKSDYAGNGYVIPPRPTCYRFSQFTDGLSMTVVVGEKAFNASIQTPESWYFDEPFFLGGSGGTARKGVAILADGATKGYKQNWGSAHAKSAHFLFADGSVRDLAFDTPWSIMAAQLIPNDGDLVAAP